MDDSPKTSTVPKPPRQEVDSSAASGCPEETRLRPLPLTVKQANALVARWHRHHKPSRGGLWAVGAQLGEDVVGAAVVGRPVARRLDDGRTVELVRLVVREGIKNVASFLLARVRRAAAILGWARVVTYTLPTESGASLRGADWRLAGPAGGGSWSRAGRPRADRHPTEVKLRWEVDTRV